MSSAARRGRRGGALAGAAADAAAGEPGGAAVGAPFGALAAALIAAGAVAACGAGESEGTTDARAADVPSIGGTVDLRIGTLDGAEPYVFGRVSGVALDDAGRIFVVDAQADELRVFSAAGEFLFRIGRSGAGPGELAAPCCPARGPDGMLWVRDGGNSRYNGYEVGDDGARYVRTVRMAHGDRNRWAPLTFDADGRLIDIGTRPGSGVLPETHRFHLDSAGGVVHDRAVPAPPRERVGLHTVERQADGGGARLYLWQPYGPMQLVAHSPRGGWARALSDRYTVEWNRSDGTSLQVGSGLEIGPELTPDERRRADERLSDRLVAMNVSRRDLPFEIPARKPPLRDLFFDRAGRLWVEKSVPAGESRAADVYGREGARVATVSWPADVDLSFGYVRPEVALGTTRDSLGVQRVVRLTFR